MTEREIATVLESRFVAKVGKYLVKLAFPEEKAEEAWMSARQLAILDRCFLATPHGHSTERIKVIGYWNDNGYYAYSRVEKTPFIEPMQYDLSDLKETE